MFVHLLFAWQTKFSISDNCVDTLLNIVLYFLTTLQFVFGFESFCHIVDLFPGTLYKARKLLNLHVDEFVKFVVCPACHKLFAFDDAIVMVNGRRESKLCDHVKYPNHPNLAWRKPCGSPLMKKVLSANGKNSSFYPVKVYCYQRIQTSLQRILGRKDIQSLLKRVIVPQPELFYIYDGDLWSNFKDCNGNRYFQDQNNLAGMLNIDWFQPFSGSEYSVGAIYMVLLNLPRELRFKKENVLLIGLIPGPKEPELTVNTYLGPLVNELLALWRGINLRVDGDMKFYRFVLLCISSDLPATRKCCGFMSFNAKKGMNINIYP